MAWNGIAPSVQRPQSSGRISHLIESFPTKPHLVFVTEELARRIQ